jgi:hypothetical protein
MIKLSKNLTRIILLICLIISLFWFKGIITSYNSEIVFKDLNGLYIIILLSGIFLTIYHKNNPTDRVGLLKSKYLTVFILIISLVFLGFYIVQLIKFSWLTKELLYWQISTPILAIISIIVFIILHIKFLKESNVP